MNKREFLQTAATGCLVLLLPFPPKPKKYDKLYWVVRDGHWDDPKSWSDTPGGVGGVSVPMDDTEIILIPPPHTHYSVRIPPHVLPHDGNITIGGEHHKNWSVKCICDTSNLVFLEVVGSGG